jgi:hypothetical protein
MRQAPEPILTRHRLARLDAWARLWLMWCVGAVAAWWSDGGRAPARALDPLARHVGALIVLNAAARMPVLARAKHWRGRRKHAALRTVAGAPLRRAMRGRDYPSRVIAILTVMRDAERHIARLLRRLRRGLTRLRVLLPESEAAPAPRAIALAPACADTS